MGSYAACILVGLNLGNLMDEVEAIAHEYLEGLALGVVVYEPDGNVPPDLLVDSRIAVEVRRLNQHFIREDTIEPLETEQFRMLGRIRGLLEGLGAPVPDRTWHFIFRFARPLPEWRPLKQWLRAELKGFLHAPSHQPYTADLDGTFSFSLVLGTHRAGQSIVLGGYSDYDSGGWVMAEVQRNVKVVLAEKTAKVAPYRHRYAEWWIILVDYIALGLNQNDREQMKSMIELSQPWERLVILDPARRALPWTLLRGQQAA